MLTNCKPGDLAVVIRCESAPENIGAVVEVLRVSLPCPCGCMDTKRYWACVTKGRALIAFGGFFGLERVASSEADVADHCLRPIRDPGDDAVDEILQRVGAPAGLVGTPSTEELATTARASVWRALAIAAALSLGIPAAQAEDSWGTAAHAEHAAGSALLAGLATKATGSELEGFGIAVAIGALKEAHDASIYPRDCASWKSFLSDVAGAYVGAKAGGLFVEAQSHGFAIGLRRAF